MAIKIASLKFKGGIGSSSIVNTLASIYSEDKKVLIVDADNQNTQITLLNARGKADKNSSLSGVLNGGFDPKKCIIEINENLHLLQSGGKSIETFNKKYNSDATGSTRLKEAMTELDSEYDVILYDASPTLNLLHQNILVAADYVILPCDLDVLSLSASRSMIHFIENTKIEMAKLDISVADILGIIPNRRDGRRIVDDQILDDLYRLEDQDLLAGGTVFNALRDSSNMKTAQARRKPLNIVYPKGNLTEDFRELAKNIETKINERSIHPSLFSVQNTNTVEAMQ